eukprot:TRINITY_DN54417_c0_g1_i1.p1 TRINITY_DN54417_c0_g1~~TRINITY_DN54417_c0_g1_i1.p1  ORF type:complete len:220 (-),score=24.09 TRINITY_DN54417_c0_g1_i1:338-997(-)
MCIRDSINAEYGEVKEPNMGSGGKSRSGTSGKNRPNGKSTACIKNVNNKLCNFKKAVSSSKSSGCVTAQGSTVRNAKAYAATGATMYSALSGSKVHDPSKFTAAVNRNSMQAAAQRVVKQNPEAKAFTYVLTLPGGEKYVGETENPSARLMAHSCGSGARVTQELKPESVTLIPHNSVAAAKKAETSGYHAMKAKHGTDRVRGAGNTARFSIARKLGGK